MRRSPEPARPARPSSVWNQLRWRSNGPTKRSGTRVAPYARRLWPLAPGGSVVSGEQPQAAARSEAQGPGEDRSAAALDIAGPEGDGPRPWRRACAATARRRSGVEALGLPPAFIGYSKAVFSSHRNQHCARPRTSNLHAPPRARDRSRCLSGRHGWLARYHRDGRSCGGAKRSAAGVGVSRPPGGQA